MKKRNLRKEFITKGFDEKEYKKYWLKNKAHYIRKKLTVLHLYSQGLGVEELVKKTSHNPKTINNYLNLYLEGGFELLCKKQEQPKKGRLTGQQLLEFKWVLLNHKPVDFGLAGVIWTGNIMIVFLYLFYGVTYDSGIYSLLSRLGLSYQKAHQDYAESDPVQAKAHLDTLRECVWQADEQTGVLFFDEFSVTELPSAYRAWAQKNTRPKVATRQKKDDEQMPC